MRIDTTSPVTVPASARPSSSAPSTTASAPKEAEPSSSKADEFQPTKGVSWAAFAAGARRLISPKVMQARADQAAGAGAGTTKPLAEVIHHCAEKLPNDEKHAPIRALYAEASELAKAGDHGKAADKLDRALSRYEEEIAEAPSMKNGGVEGTRNLSAQYRVLEDMKARGVEASHPPTRDEMKKYMKTFDSRADRPAARDAFEAYTKAYYVHPAHIGRPDEDIQYSVDPMKFAFNGRLYDRTEDAERAQRRAGSGLITDIETHDASAWSDVTTDRELGKVGGAYPAAAGRRVIDCEGYAFLAAELMSSAGYRFEQVAVQAKTGEQHAMTVLTDPSRRGKFTVVSNDGIHTADSKSAALDAGFAAAMPAGAEADRYYHGSSQHEAQVKMVFGGL